MVERFRKSFAIYFSESEIDQIITHYGLDSSSETGDVVHSGFLQLCTDIRFYLPNFVLGNLTDKYDNLQMYHFDEVSKLLYH